MNRTLAESFSSSIMVSRTAIGFTIPTLGTFLGFAIRLFFVLAGLAALFFMLTGALAWVTSGGEKDKVDAAQKKITAAVIGVIVMIFVLALIATLENVVFKRHICFGLTCPITIPAIFGESSNSNGSTVNTNTNEGVLFNINNPQQLMTPTLIQSSPTATPSGKMIRVTPSNTPFPTLILPDTGGG